MIEALQDIIVYHLSLGPLGFLGLLGGLLGGAMSKGGGGQQQSSPGPSRAPTTSAVEQEPQEAPRQTQAQQQPQRQPTQPKQQNVLQDLGDEMAEQQEPVAQKQAQQASPIQGLLDETNPAPDAPEPMKDQQLEVVDTINKTDDETPVARPQEETFGEVPIIEKPEVVENQLFNAATNEQPFDFQSGLPDRDISGTLSDSEFAAPQGYSYKQTSTVQGGLPARRYGVRM